MSPENTNPPADLEERLRFETLLAEVALRFVNVPADRVDGEIVGAQRRICELLGLDRSTLRQVSAKECVSVDPVHPLPECRQRHVPGDCRPALDQIVMFEKV